MDIQKHFNDTVGDFIDREYSNHQSITSINGSPRFVWNTQLSFKTFNPKRPLHNSLANAHQVVFEIFYDYLPLPLIDSCKAAINSYFKPFFLSKRESIVNWLRVRGQRTCVSAIAQYDSSTGYVFENKDLETAIRAFIESINK